MNLQLRLLPHYFKSIGIALTILPIIVACIIKLLYSSFLHLHKEFAIEMVINLAILGLFIYSCSRDKLEDEMTMLLRLRSIAFVFFLSICAVLTEPLLNKIFHEPVTIMNSRHLVFRMLIGYIICYSFLKFRR